MAAITSPSPPPLLSSSTHPSHLHDEILALEKRTWRALQIDGPSLTPFLSSDAIMQLPLGMKVTSESQPRLADILHSPAYIPWRTFALDRVDVQVVGRAGAVISYRARATRPAIDVVGSEEAPSTATAGDREDVPFEALCSSVWRYEGDRWLMCFHQQTLTT